MLATSALFATLLFAGADVSCDSAAQCNRLGSEALAAGRHAEALSLFEMQIDFADTARSQAETDADETRLSNARQIAINNAALAALKSGNCLLARAWLEAGDATHKATIANRRQLDARCAGKLDAVVHTGEFRQYAGHGAWNSITLRETGDETLQFSAFWMRVGRGPLRESGPAAMGDIEQAFVHVDGNRGQGRFEGLDPATDCTLDVRWIPGGLEIAHTDAPECRVGGAGAELSGRYWRIGEPAPRADDEAEG